MANLINDRHKKIITEFGSVSHASRKLKMSRHTVYAIIKNGPTAIQVDRIKGCGYDPVTFAHL